MNPGLVRGIGALTNIGGFDSTNVVAGTGTLDGLNGLNNVVIGYQAAPSFAGSTSVIIGAAASATFSQSTAIGYNAQARGSLGSVAIGSSAGAAVVGVSVGYQAGQNVSGSYNTLIGFQAGQVTTSGFENTALGYQAFTSGNGSDNVAIGASALMRGGGNTSVAVGSAALQFNTAGSAYGSHVAVGFKALNALTTGTPNTAIGYQAGYAPNGNTSNATTTGTYQTFIGYQSGQGSATQLSNVIAVGDNAVVNGNGAVAIGSSAGIGANSVAVGQQAGGGASATGINNVCVGYQAASQLTTQSRNTAIGYFTVTSSAVGSDNCGVGANALQGNTGSFNTAVGSAAGQRVTGTYNTLIGYGAGPFQNFGACNALTFVGTGTLATLLGQQPSYAAAFGYATGAGGTGSVAIGTDHTGAGATATQQDQFVLGTVNHSVQIPGLPAWSQALMSAATMFV